MALKFRLKGLAETFVEEIRCPGCGRCEADDSVFSTEHTRVTFQGIIVVVQCKVCEEISVPTNQRLGVMNSELLKQAVMRDARDSGEPLMQDVETVKLNVERLNAVRRGVVH